MPISNHVAGTDNRYRAALGTYITYNIPLCSQRYENITSPLNFPTVYNIHHICRVIHEQSLLLLAFTVVRQYVIHLADIFVLFQLIHSC